MTVSLDRISKSYGATLVIRDLNLHIDKGERVCLVGANGSGKTTLLRIICGLTRPESGTALINGTPPKKSTAAIGYAGHSAGVYPRLTAKENLEFFAKLQGTKPDLTGASAIGVDLSQPVRVGELSHGMRKKVAIACALQNDPELVVLDEPFAGLDADSVESIQKVLASIKSTVVFTTHSDPSAQWVTRCLEIHNGNISDKRAI